MPKRTFETNIMSAFPFDKEEGALTTLLQVEKVSNLSVTKWYISMI